MLKRWYTFCKNNNVRNLPFKTLRATCASLLCECGVPIQEASKILGHSTIKTTEKHYVAVSKEKKKTAMNMIGSILERR